MPGPRAANLERSPGGLPGHVLQSRYPAGRGGRGVPVVAQRRKAMAVPSPAPQDRFPLPRPLPAGTWHWQLREVSPSFLPFLRGENCSP